MQEEKINRCNKKVREGSKEEAEKKWRGRAVRFGEELLWGCAAWLLGQASLLFGTYPLGLALLCGSARHTVSILVGLILTSLSNLNTPLIYICTYTVAAIVRVVVSMTLDDPEASFDLSFSLKKKLKVEGEREKKVVTRFHLLQSAIKEEEGVYGKLMLVYHTMRDAFSEHTTLRLCTASVSALIISLYRIISNGFRFYDLFAALFAVLFTPIVALLYSVITERKKKEKLISMVAGGIFLFSLVYAAKSVTLLSFPLSPILALFFTLFFCGKDSAVIGIGTSLLCGIAYDPMHAPAFLLAALVYLFFHHMGKESTAILLSVASSVVWSVYVGGATMLFSSLPAALLAGSAYTIWQKLLEKEILQEQNGDTRADKDRMENDGESRENDSLQMERFRRKDANDRFRGISDAFSSLSEMFYNLSDRFRRPGTLDLRRICDHSFDSFCNDCPNKTVCWGLEYSETLGNVNELISALHIKGKVDRGQIDERLLHRCTRIDSILERINCECARLTGEMLRNNRTEIFAMDYESAAEIINDALEEENGEYSFDKELGKKVSEYLSDAGIKAGSVSVYGNRRRRILVRGADIEHAKVSSEILRSDLGEMCGSELSPPVFEVENNVSTMILQAKQMISVCGAQNNVSADGGVSGDSINLFSNKKDYFYALISDGMGAGKEAALTSGLCSVFMEKMLRAGNRAATSLRMLNNMIASRASDSTRECSSTIDLLELDLMTGNASFIKSGAAPSFVIRKDVVRRLQLGTVPIGILCTLDAQETRFRLREGDTVVMISDGILQGDPDCEWITSFLSTVSELEPEEIVYRICLHAAEREEHDDCSAVALRIHRA